MYLWKICLLIIICILPIGLLLRRMSNQIISNNLNWTKDSGLILKQIKEKNMFLWLLLVVEGIISNSALLLLIISIPIYFILHI